MAWNISVTTYTPEERWNWVYNGVKLLRDEGIPLNPRAVNLYKQLAWTYNNKMSETLDDFHMDLQAELGVADAPGARPAARRWRRCANTVPARTSSECSSM